MVSDPTSSIPTPVGWTVLSQAEDSQITQDGRVEKGVTVRFQTTSGTVGSVFVPNFQYTPDNVRAAISSRAAQLGAVESMSSSDGTTYGG